MSEKVDLHKEKIFALRLGPRHRDLLERIAKKNRRTLTEEVRIALEDHGERHGEQLQTVNGDGCSKYRRASQKHPPVCGYAPAIRA
jgi:hypothetical protein